MKNSLGQGNNISDNIDSLKKNILEERWDETEKEIQELEDNCKIFLQELS